MTDYMNRTLDGTKALIKYILEFGPTPKHPCLLMLFAKKRSFQLLTKGIPQSII